MSRMEEQLGQIVSGLRSYAKSAGARFALRTLHALSGATRVVAMQRSDVRKESPLVFDLTVEKHNSYLANGLLVSNSDAFQQLAVGLRRGELHMDNNRGVFGMSDGTMDEFMDDAIVAEPWQDNTGIFG